jgi:flagellar hook-basal body complex protein FliE
MSNMAIDSVLAQIRSLSAQGAGQVKPAAQAVAGLQPGNAGAVQGPAFGDLFKQGIDAVNNTSQQADALANAWERGAPGVDLAQVMVETQKASVSFQALAQVRNRLISAYQDIMNMQI